MNATGISRAAKSLGRPNFDDVIAGLVTGLFSIPEGMAYASIGGFNPVAGLYSGVVSTIVGSVLARTVLMVTTLTSALALPSRNVLTGTDRVFGAVEEAVERGERWIALQGDGAAPAD